MDAKIRMYKKRYTDYTDGVVNVTAERSQTQKTVSISQRNLDETLKIDLKLTPSQARELAANLINSASFADGED